MAAVPAVTADVADRCVAQVGSFFESVPDGADAYILKNTLNDWNDEQCRHILTRCREAMRDDSSVLVIGPAMPEEIGAPESLTAALADFEMLVTTGGRERTIAEYEALFAAARLKMVDVSALPNYPGFSVIEAQAV